MSYKIEFEDSNGDMLEAGVDINFPNVFQDNFPENAVDETARRHLVSKILVNGGRVIKIKKAGQKWKPYEEGD